MRFGHKYNAPTLFGVAYTHLRDGVSTFGIPWLETQDPKTLDLCKMVDISHAAEEFQAGLKMVDNAEVYAGEDFKPSLLSLCIAWFTEHIKYCREHEAVMRRLTKTTMLKMVEHATKRPRRQPLS